MSTGAVEFIDEPDPPPAEPQPATGHWTTLLRAVAVLGWVAAAVLAVLAPFQAVYGSVRVPRDYADYLSSVPLGVDGWGRTPGGSGGGVRFGIALVVCGAVFAGLAVLDALAVAGSRRETARPVRFRRLSTAGAIGAVCLVAGVVGVLGLYVHSVVDGAGLSGWTVFAPTSSPGVGAAYSSSLKISTPRYPVGPCLWLAVAALGSALLATAAHLLAERADRRLAG